MKSIKILILSSAVALLAAACGSKAGQELAAEDEPTIIYGIIADNYRLEDGVVGSGETVGKILNSYGVTPLQIDRLDKASDKIFPLRNIRAGNSYKAFIHEDSIYAPHLDYLVYDINATNYVVFGFHDNDSVSVEKGEKEFQIHRQKKTATINSSLWGAIMEQKMPHALADEMENIYQWSINFFSIKEGDNFTVIYDERFIDDTVSVGIGRIWGAKFNHDGKDYYAIPFKQNSKLAYWDSDGKSMKKQLLKTPLKYTRISSKFTRARLHPIYKVYRPHLGIDYAAPKGTPVRAVADGVITFKGWGGGGGNTLKIQHSGGLMSGYLHLNGFAKGINKGSRVSQGQLIGYVGSTGASTGPHLDFRIWKNGTPINPQSIPQTPAEPLAKEYMDQFGFVRDRIVAELDGDVPDSMKITQIDSIVTGRSVAKTVQAEKPTTEQGAAKQSKKQR